MVRVFLMLIPYHFDLFKGVFWLSKYRILYLEENYDTRCHLYFRCCDYDILCLLPRICQGQKKSMESEQEAIS